MDPWGTGTQPPETFPYHCPNCDKAVLAEVLARWQVNPNHGDEWETHQWTATRCQSCNVPLLFIQQTEAGMSDWPEREQAFPETDRQLPWPVPANIRNDFAEARRDMRTRAYTSAALMARRVVDAIRKEQGYPQGSLFDGLTAMKDAGVINDRLYEWADTARVVGNEGAHDTDVPVGHEDAEEVLRFIEALADYLYVFQRQYEEFKRRRRVLKEGGDPRALSPFVISDLRNRDENPARPTEGAADSPG